MGKNLKSIFVITAVILMSNINIVIAGPLAYGVCQTGCNILAVACYSAAGFTFGTVTAGAAIPATIAACNTALGLCMAACVAAGFMPTPYKCRDNASDKRAENVN